MKRSRTLLGLLVTLALALLLVMVAPVYAFEAALTKGVTPPQPNVYNLTDTIHYTMMIINLSGTDNITVTALWDVLPDGLTVYPPGPVPPYTLAPGQNQTYTYDWVATRTGTVVNRIYVDAYQETGLGNEYFSLSGEKSSLVIGQEVGGTASLVDKLRLVAPWAGLAACVAVIALLLVRKRRHA